MSLWTNVLIAFGLAMDAFAVSIAAGLIIERVTARHFFRAAFHFGLFQALMVILGWLAGSNFAKVLAAREEREAILASMAVRALGISSV